MRRITWTNDLGKVCVLTITDGSSTTTDMTPAGTPFVTQMDESVDVFTPIRTQTGYVRVVVDSISDIDDLVGSQPLSRSLRLAVDGTTAWYGFLACETFSQPWDKGPIELELPVISPLEALKGFSPSNDVSDLGYIKFGQFLVNMNAQLGYLFGHFIFPNLTEPETTLAYQFCMMNYATQDKESTTGYTVETYYDILEDICKFFGWQVQENAGKLIFLAADTTALATSGGTTYNYVDYTYDKLTSFMSGNDVTPDVVAWSTGSMEVYGNAHDMEWISGRKKVKVVGQVNEVSENLAAFDFSEEVGGSYEGTYKVAGSQRTEKYYTRNFIDSAIQSAFNPDENIKFNNWQANANTQYGACFVRECFSWYNPESLQPDNGDSGFTDRLIFKLSSAYAGQAFASTGGKLIYTGGPAYADSQLLINFTMKKSSSYNEVWSSSVDGFMRFNVYVGGTLLAECEPLVKDGAIFTRDNKPTQTGVRLDCPVGMSGLVEISFVCPNATSSTGMAWDYSPYYAIEGLTVSIVKNWQTDVTDIPSENKSMLDTGAAFSDDWERECGLTCCQGAESGRGIIIDASGETLPASLYGDGTPEEEMATRAKNYYQQARLRLGVVVKGGTTMHDACVTYRIMGNYFIMLSQSVDWKSGEVKAWFYEEA